MADDKAGLVPDLTGQTALVTGASSGIGRAIAQRLAAAGAHVALVGRSVDGLDATLKAIAEAGGSATAHPLDLMEAGALARAIGFAHERDGRLDILVNNAGVYHPGAIVDQDPAEWEAMLRVNVLALLEGCQAAIRLMRADGRSGHIINISSLATRMEAMGVYGASKCAVEMITETLRKELEGDPIRIAQIIPGAFSTNLGRHFPPEAMAKFAENLAKGGFTRGQGERSPIMGQTDDIARAVLFILAQPIELNVYEVIVRPQAAVTIS